MFEDDKQLQQTIESIKESIFAGFDAASQYANTFEVYREFYGDNERQDIDAFMLEADGKNVYIFLGCIRFLVIETLKNYSYLLSNFDQYVVPAVSILFMTSFYFSQILDFLPHHYPSIQNSMK